MLASTYLFTVLIAALLFAIGVVLYVNNGEDLQLNHILMIIFLMVIPFANIIAPIVYIVTEIIIYLRNKGSRVIIEGKE